jgi:ubiquinone/menaquinone biosynthesis C-methylase UbiE
MVNKSENQKSNPAVLQWTGERMVPDQNSYGSIEHLHRYSFLSKFLTEKMVVLDVACGEGYGTYMLSKQVNRVIGVDISIEAIEHAKKIYSNNNIHFINANATSIPLEDSLFDVIVSFETLEHLEEHEKLIKEFKRLLKNDGLLIISTPDKRFFSKNNPNPFHVKELNFFEFKSLLNKFFPSSQFLFQKTIHGSIIFNNEAPNLLEQYSGDFENISRNTQVTEPEFIIGFASPDESFALTILNSFFDATAVHNEELINNRNIETKYFNIITSRKFRLFNSILRKLGYEFDV